MYIQISQGYKPPRKKIKIKKRTWSWQIKMPKFKMTRSTKLCPTFSFSTTVWTPKFRSKRLSPIPETCKSWGLKMAPPAKITPLRAWMVTKSLKLLRASTPLARLPSKLILFTCFWSMAIFGLSRWRFLISFHWENNKQTREFEGNFIFGQRFGQFQIECGDSS